jgi:multiple sugar transport system permease protein
LRLASAVGTAAKYLIIAAGAMAMLVPFAWMLSASLMTPTEITARPPVWVPRIAQWHNYREVVHVIPMGRMYLNSLFVTIATVLGLLFTSSLAGYAFAKFEFPGRNVLFVGTLGTMMIPFFVTLIPVFYIVKQFGWLDSYAGLIIPGLVSAYGIFLMRQFILGIPDELIDAARIDGASEFRIYYEIVIPLCPPALATLGTFTSIGRWNAFLWPLLVITSRELFTVPLGLNSLRLYAGEARNLNLLMAGTAIAIVPVLILFVSMQRFFVQGIALTGLKG